MTWIKTILLMFLITIVHQSNENGFFGESSLGVYGKTYYLVGEELNLVCNISKLSFDNGDCTAYTLHFNKKQTKIANGNKTHITSNYIKVENNFTVVLSIPNLTIDHYNEYECCSGDNGCGCNPGETNDKCGCEGSQDIDIQYGPQSVVNVTCIVDNWTVNLYCTWQHPVPYNMELSDTSVSVYENSSSVCIGKLLKECSWPANTFVIKDIYNITITVTNNERNISASSFTSVHRMDNVKPAPVNDLKIIELENGCLNLSWIHESKELKRFKILSKESGQPLEPLTDNLTVEYFEKCNVKLQTQYSFCVSTFPSGSDKGFWSDEKCENINPKVVAIPSFGPKNSSYTVSVVQNGSYNIQIYWQKPETNDFITNYLITQNGQLLANVTAETYTASVQLNCNCNHTRLELFAANEKGQSKYPSKLLLLLNIDVPTRVKTSFSIEVNNGLRAVWDTDDKMAYSVYWCKGKYPICEEQINWTTLSLLSTSYALPNLESDPGLYIYGISVLKDASVPAPIVNVNPYENYMIVKFSLECSYDNRVKLTSYSIQYCVQIKCNDPMHVKTLSVSAKESQLAINSLSPKTSYQITVRGISGNTTGLDSVLEVATKEANVEQTWIVAAVLGPVCLLTLIIFSVIMFRKCHRSKQKANMYLQSEEFSYDKKNSQALQPVKVNDSYPLNDRIYDSSKSNSSRLSPPNTSDSAYLKITLASSDTDSVKPFQQMNKPPAEMELIEISVGLSKTNGSQVTSPTEETSVSSCETKAFQLSNTKIESIAFVDNAKSIQNDKSSVEEIHHGNYITSCHNQNLLNLTKEPHVNNFPATSSDPYMKMDYIPVPDNCKSVHASVQLSSTRTPHENSEVSLSSFMEETFSPQINVEADSSFYSDQSDDSLKIPSFLNINPSSD
ncbi:cytokine receptor domeless [Biomphalaria pfeifferi]|uniref:Cytokine receptor domeless n=1 Tax=Biomphalaria pfeifferi TaxID=112525 RepID=A0AAD8CAU5_BIOPF|nr:cytokine receptor domeless [Biomphalaria pfeifferi]